MALSNPLAIVFCALYGVLVALYLWERHRRRENVSSLLLWEAVPEAVARKSRFRPDLLFLLQLTLLTMLIAGLAGPYLSGRAGDRAAPRRIFVLDASASMQTREGQSSRFDQARKVLRERIDALPEDSEIMLIAAAHRPQVIVPFTADRKLLLRQLEGMEPYDTGTNLELALAAARLAAQRSDRDAVVELLTDMPTSDLPEDWRDWLGVQQFGESDENLAIEGLQVHQGRFQGYANAQASIFVRNFSRHEAHGVLTLRLGDEIVRRQGFSLQPRSGHGFSFGSFSRPGVLHARLETDDALPADDDAYGWVGPMRPLRVLVVSDSAALARDLATIEHSTPNLVFRFASPREETPPPSDADVVVFHRHAPATLPDRPVLLVYPGESREWFRVRGDAADVRIADWNDRHAILKNIRPEIPYPFRKVRLVDLPDWAEVLLAARHDGREIPLAFATERAGKRMAAFAFDLEGEHLLRADNVGLLLLFMETLDWLAASEEPVTLTRTGTTRVFQNLPPLTRRIAGPHLSAVVPAGEPVRLEPLHVGLYRVSVDGTELRVLANLFDPAESDIGRPPPGPFAAPPVISARGGGAGRPGTFSPWLYAVGALLFVVEWLAAARRA